MFQLKNYLDEMRAIATQNGCTLTAAVDKFVVNLNTMHEHYKGTGTINFHVLGQHWCNLGYEAKIEQKDEAKRLISNPSRATSRRRRV